MCNTCGAICVDEIDTCAKCEEPVCFEGECLFEIDSMDGTGTVKLIEVCGPCKDKAETYAK